MRFPAFINYHSAGQLLLTPACYTTDYYPPDSTLFDAITGNDDGNIARRGGRSTPPPARGG